MRATTHANGFLPVSTRLGITGGAPARLRSYTCPPSVERFAGQPRGLRRLPFGAERGRSIRGLICRISDDGRRARELPAGCDQKVGGPLFTRPSQSCAGLRVCDRSQPGPCKASAGCSRRMTGSDQAASDRRARPLPTRSARAARDRQRNNADRLASQTCSGTAALRSTVFLVKRAAFR